MTMVGPCDWCGYVPPSGRHSIRLLSDATQVGVWWLCLACKDEALGRVGIAIEEAREQRVKLTAAAPGAWEPEPVA